MGLNQVIGHDRTKTLLAKTLENGHISHAYILEGPKGVGRLTLAKAFAEEIVAQSSTVHSAESHPDITVVTNQLYEPEKTQTNILVNTVRNMKKDVYIRPYMAQRKVYIVPGADTMQAPAQNSLLKVFEEPPPYCTIVLIAENANSFLPTILSRAVLLRLAPLPLQMVREYLKGPGGMEAQEADNLAALSGGSIGRALELSREGGAVELRGAVLEHVMALLSGGNRAMYDFIRFLKKNRTFIDFILSILSQWFRDVMHCKLGVSQEIINSDQQAQLQAFCSGITREAAFRFSEITARYARAVAQNANYPIAMLCMVTEYWEEIHGRNYRSTI